MQILENIYYSFPVRLVFLHFKKHQVVLLFWIILMLLISGITGNKFGIPYLLLDPEYLGKVGYLSYFLVGIGFGGFLVTWNLTSYLLNSYRFPFMASLNRPFAMFFINNSLIPLAFGIAYLYFIVDFRYQSEFQTYLDIMLDVLGFMMGIIVVLLITALYFQNTNKNIFGIINPEQLGLEGLRKKISEKRDQHWADSTGLSEDWRVENYVSTKLNTRLTRNVAHYDTPVLKSVYRQHHFNALIAQIATLTVLIALGYLIEYPVFQIPAACSLFLLFSIFVSLSGVFRFWTGGWSTSALILILISLNFLTKLNLMDYENKAYGLDYEGEQKVYSQETLAQMSSDENIASDKQATIKILERWKEKQLAEQPGIEKPKMVVLVASGGGLRSALLTTAVLQSADSLLGGNLLDKTFLMTGSSGGMFGMAYLRELFYQKTLGGEIDLQDHAYRENISKDLLNAICFTILTNDLFYPWQRFKMNGHTYRKDRGYMMERQLNLNTGKVLERPLVEYKVPEEEAQIPMMIISGTIVNDSRRLFISPQQVSYMTKPDLESKDDLQLEIDGIDFGAFFKQQESEHLRLSTALRMNGTYPYILPQVHLPSEPRTTVMDAGIRDNYGIETAARFLNVFSDWILENTSEVILVQIRGNRKIDKIEEAERKSILGKLVDPVGNVYVNLGMMQDYNHDNYLNFTNRSLKDKLKVIRFEYVPDKENERASMSFHLATKEKRDILHSIRDPFNVNAFQQLHEALRIDGPSPITGTD